MIKIREFLRGKKAYITAAIGLLGAVAAWADGQISGVALIASVWAAAQAVFIRAGIANELARKGGE
ncbi:MAG: hypothetical protein BIFFINMI_04273 [Phycisphaerae bacterium]|nr:hypothetical protein [Phycisphaerae bacterium]